MEWKYLDPSISRSLASDSYVSATASALPVQKGRKAKLEHF